MEGGDEVLQRRDRDAKLLCRVARAISCRSVGRDKQLTRLRDNRPLRNEAVALGEGLEVVSVDLPSMGVVAAPAKQISMLGSSEMRSAVLR